MALRLLASLAAVLILGGQDNPKPLKEFKSREGSFSVLLPETPKKEVSPIDDPKGDQGPQYQFSVDRGNGAYLVSYQANHGLRNVDDEAADRALKRAQERVRTSSNAKLVSEKKIKLQDKYPGREYVLEIAANSGILRSRMYLVKGMLYQVIAVGAADFAKSEEADRVLNSFKLKK
jgi:hypothetical protein